MKILNCNDGKLIALSSALDRRGKFLYGFYFIMFFGGTGIFSWLLLWQSPDAITIAISLFGLVVSLIAGFRFGHKAVFAEKIGIRNSRLQIIKRGFYKTVSNYNIDKIVNFRHLGKPELTKHPLAGKTFDYLGFQTEQQVINEMHGDNRVAFDYEGKTIQFGEEIYSWDYGELITLIEAETGVNLSFQT